MNKIYKSFCKALYQMVLLAAMVSVNMTCLRRYYQDEVDAQLDGWRVIYSGCFIKRDM